MEHFHHKTIKKFNLSGVIQDEAIIGRLRSEYIRLLVNEMRLAGYVPRFDIDPDFTTGYNEKKNFFEFELTVHGVYVGKKQAQWIHGLDGTRVISTQKSKSKELSQVQD